MGSTKNILYLFSLICNELVKKKLNAFHVSTYNTFMSEPKTTNLQLNTSQFIVFLLSILVI